MAHRLAVARQARRPVGQIALVLLLANREAEIRARAEAVDALAALRREERHDVVARLDGSDVGADALDDARALVSEHGRRVARRIGARRGVEIGVADAAGDEADEHLTRPRLREIDLLDDERLPELLEHCCANLHVRSLRSQRRSRTGAVAEPSLLGAAVIARPDRRRHGGRPP